MNRFHALMICFFVVGITAYANGFLNDTTNKSGSPNPPVTAVIPLQTCTSEANGTKGKATMLASINPNVSTVKCMHTKAIRQTSDLLHETLSDLGEAQASDSMYLETVFRSK